MEKSAKIYVAGHRGMVGSAIVRKLVEKGYNNLVLRTHQELDLTDQRAVREFFEKERPEYVFLAAAKVGGILANSTYKADFIYQNIMIAANVIEASYRYGVKKLLNLGSSCIYPKNAPQPMKEEYLLTGPLEPTNEPYAVAKISAIKLCRYFNEQYGTNFISVMPTNLYGPNDNYNLETAHVIPALIRKFHLGKLLMNDDWDGIKRDLTRYPIGFGLEKELNIDDKDSIIRVLEKVGVKYGEVTVWGSGEVYREFMHVDDLADACVYLMENVDANELRKVSPDYFVNVGVGEDIKLSDLFYKIAKITEFHGYISKDSTKPDGVFRKLLDISTMIKFGWQPKISLDDGLRNTYKQYVVSGDSRE
ncbi:GDP-L-fucose synthase family protein [Fervidobacterium thailandense]|uniref:GDP-L-fucose synthase n=1 Tax=Fervidobacterium thailandense TaxID=1008305 RepID=A0A1E3G3Z4_9BACT|nr:GDP-L-fucose synthase [Fervidobacterium thailandense]ODN30974.1 GDP-fucose synthetase [Fervidobacterium thailandense]